MEHGMFNHDFLIIPKSSSRKSIKIKGEDNPSRSVSPIRPISWLLTRSEFTILDFQKEMALTLIGSS
jgi:hypothetical protein